MPITRWIRNFDKNDSILNNNNYTQILKKKLSKINFQHYKEASKEIHESKGNQAIEAEEDSGKETNDGNNDVVL